MKWLVALTLVVASASIIVPALLRESKSAQSTHRLDQIHEAAAF